MSILRPPALKLSISRQPHSYFTFFFAHFLTLLAEESVKSLPFTTFAPFVDALIPVMLPEIPLSPLVQNGTIFFPLRL